MKPISIFTSLFIFFTLVVINFSCRCPDCNSVAGKAADSIRYVNNYLKGDDIKPKVFLSFSKDKAKPILLADAQAMFEDFQRVYPKAPSAVSVERQWIDELLKLNPDKIRMYFGLKNHNEDSLRLILVGVKGKKNVFLQINGREHAVDYTDPCPEDCPTDDDNVSSRTRIKP